MDTKKGDGARSVSVVGHWERQLVLNVLQQSRSRENNIGWLINLIILPCQTPVSVFTSLLIPHQSLYAAEDTVKESHPDFEQTVCTDSGPHIIEEMKINMHYI